MKIVDKYKDINIVNAKTINIFDDIFVFPKYRAGYAEDNKQITVPTYFYYIKGSFDGFKNKIMDFDLKLENIGNSYSLKEELSKVEDDDFVENFNLYWGSDNFTLSSSFVITKISPILFKICKKQKNRDILIKKLNIMIEDYIKNENDIPSLKNSLINILYWVSCYFDGIMDNYYLDKLNPKIVYYKEVYKDQLYFFYLIFLCSIDIIIINSTKKEDFLKDEIILNDINILEYDDVFEDEEIFEYSKKEEIKRETTIAYNADIEIKEILNDENSGIYRKWQFENYKLEVNILKTTLDEIKIFSKTQARFRPGFEVQDNKIIVPNIFAKISGVMENKKEYSNFYYNTIKENPKQRIRMSFSNNEKIYSLDKNIILNNRINREGIKKINGYNLSYLSNNLQNNILDIIQEVISSKDIFFKFSKDPDISFNIVYEIIGLEKEFINLIQNFDYPYDVPQIIIFNDDEKPCLKSDAIRLAFFVLAGFDVIIFSPSGFNDIEYLINEYVFDIHKLDYYDAKFKFSDLLKYKNNISNKFFDFIFKS